MRCYYLNNFYLGNIHAGIQSSHAQQKLARKYLSRFKDLSGHQNPKETVENYEDWLENHETSIVLNAGWHSDLNNIIDFLASNRDHTYAWASFNEEKDAINEATTNVAIILPYHMYAYSQAISSFISKKIKSERVTFTPDEYDDETVKKIDFEMEMYPDNTVSLRDYITKSVYDYNLFDLKLIRRLSRMRTMS